MPTSRSIKKEILVEARHQLPDTSCESDAFFGISSRGECRDLRRGCSDSRNWLLFAWAEFEKNVTGWMSQHAYI